MRPSILIVDDEAPARAALKDTLSACAVEHELAGEASSAKKAVTMLNELRPDILLLDIRLGDGTGFDVLERAVWKDAAVIFTTAYDQYAIRAFECAAIHYLLKPVQLDELREALVRATNGLRTDPVQLETAVGNMARPDHQRIVVPCAEGMHVLEPANVLRCEADGNYTRIHLTGGQRLMTARTLKDFEEMLKPFGFERIHPAHLVNLMHVRMYMNRDGGALLLSDGLVVPIAQRRRQQILDALARL